MNYTVKKSCLLIVLATAGISYAVDDLINDSDRTEMQQESNGVSQKFFESIAQGFTDIKNGVQETATDIAAWTQAQMAVASKHLEKTRKSSLVQNAHVQLKKSLVAAKNFLNTGKKEFQKIDLAQATDNLKVQMHQGLTSVQRSSKKLFKSVKSWFDGSSDSFIQTVKGEDLVLLGGATALAAIVIGGVTYILYKSGVIKRVGTEMKNHPFASLSTAAAVTILSAAFIMYNTGKITVQ